MLGDSGDDAAASRAPEAGADGVGGGVGGEVGVAGSSSGGFSEEDRGRSEEGDRNSVGNRWPRQETLALLKIRLEMDVAFRDSSLKGPLWEEVSRKLAELGYHRSAKKCKEKFENVYKYHKRTKEGRASKLDGKTYRFFDQLEALDNQPPPRLVPHPKSQPPVAATSSPLPLTNPPTVSQTSTVPSPTNPTNRSQQNTLTQPIPNPTQPLPPNPTNHPPPLVNPANPPQIMPAEVISASSSSSSSSDEDEALEGSRKRKRKWKNFFERLMRDVIEKQEELQRKFLEAIEKRERDRMVREEAWKMQEMARLSREQEMLAQERSRAAAKDAAVLAFLQKITKQPNPLQLQGPENALPPVVVLPRPQPPPPPPPVLPANNLESTKTGNGGNFVSTSSSRWPKTEVEALIKLRTNLDTKYQDSGPKGPLWEEISASMRRLGYDRSAKRCKEKWENINKYFKKVKESNKKRLEDSKTCPYFHQLDALYREKNKIGSSVLNPSFDVRPENTNPNPMVPLMVRPEQQWPLQEEDQPESAMEDTASENMEENQEEEEEEEDGEEEQEEEEE